MAKKDMKRNAKNETARSAKPWNDQLGENVDNTAKMAMEQGKSQPRGKRKG